jgi:hypothetical protein
LWRWPVGVTGHVHQTECGTLDDEVDVDLVE